MLRLNTWCSTCGSKPVKGYSVSGVIDYFLHSGNCPLCQAEIFMLEIVL